MTDRQNQPPEADNSEQDHDAAEQAQTVAEEALKRTERRLNESEKALSGDETDDFPDLIDRMKQMESNGRIDMDAFRGEPNDDDEEGLLGDQGEE